MRPSTHCFPSCRTFHSREACSFAELNVSEQADPENVGFKGFHLVFLLLSLWFLFRFLFWFPFCTNIQLGILSETTQWALFCLTQIINGSVFSPSWTNGGCPSNAFPSQSLKLDNDRCQAQIPMSQVWCQSTSFILNFEKEWHEGFCVVLDVGITTLIWGGGSKCKLHVWGSTES